MSSWRDFPKFFSGQVKEFYPLLQLSGQYGQSVLVLVLTLADIFLNLRRMIPSHGRGKTYIRTVDFADDIHINNFHYKKGCLLNGIYSQLKVN